MGYYPDLSPGDPLDLSARRANDLSHLLNAMNGFGGKSKTVSAPGAVRVPVYNAGSSALLAGQAVGFVSSGVVMVDGLVPCSALSSETTGRWGVLTGHLDPGQGGGCLIAGAVTISRIIGSGGECAAPLTGNGAIVSGAQVWSRGTTGVPLLFAGSGGGVALLGGGGVGAFVAVVVTSPTGGIGEGAIHSATLTASGGVVHSGASISVRMPYLDGLN